MQNMMIRFIFLLAILLPTLSSAMSVDNIFVFGDSLSDGGNVYNTTGMQFPPPPYANDSVMARWLSNNLRQWPE